MSKIYCVLGKASAPIAAYDTEEAANKLKDTLPLGFSVKSIELNYPSENETGDKLWLVRIFKNGDVHSVNSQVVNPDYCAGAIDPRFVYMKDDGKLAMLSYHFAATEELAKTKAATFLAGVLQDNKWPE